MKDRVKAAVAACRGATTMTVTSAAGTKLSVGMEGAATAGVWGWTDRPGTIAHWPGGVVVTRIYGGGPADKAGIRKGDVILAVDDQAVEDLQSLRFRVATGVLGGRTKVRIWRDAAPAVVTLPLTPAPDPPADLHVERVEDAGHGASSLRWR